MEIALRLENGSIVCERCVLADTALARVRGLLGRKGLANDEGIFLRPAGSVHTAFMRFAIDVVFLDRENRVVKIAANLRPWRGASARGAKTAIELAAGEAERRGLKLGDRIIEPSAETEHQDRPRGTWKRTGANVLLGSLWLAFAAANIAQWHSKHRPVGLGAMALELMFAILFFVRRKPWVTSRAPIAWTATAVGAFGMLAARPAYHPVFGLDSLYVALQVGGALAAAYALASLGRSFGLVAANRGVRTRGPYGLVRHPVYVCYALTGLGYVLENPSIANIAIAFCVQLFQIVRIRSEEHCLLADPTYARYCERVRYRLVPLVW